MLKKYFFHKGEYDIKWLIFQCFNVNNVIDVNSKLPCFVSHSTNEEDHMEKEEVEEEEAELFILFVILWLMTTIFQLM